MKESRCGMDDDDDDDTLFIVGMGGCYLTKT